MYICQVGKKNILFVCIHNSARSQMAEAFVNHLKNDVYRAESAGIEPGNLNLAAVEAMKESGIDISKNHTNSVEEMIGSGRKFDLVITVCDETSAERCPVFPGKVERKHWSFPDPSAFRGTDAEKLEFTRKVRDAIREKINAEL
jgi:arsenate reductase